MRGRDLGYVLVAALAVSCASTEPGPAAWDATGAAASEDVESVDAIVTALYDVISGEAGEPRDWGRMRSLFAPVGARLIPIGSNGEGGYAALFATVDGYIERSAPFFEQSGFYETEVARRVERFGQIAHVFSTYESRHAPDEEPFSRGINSIQLAHDGVRWYVVTVLWDAEREGASIPARYLESGPSDA